MNKVYVISIEELKRKYSYEELYKLAPPYRREKVDKYMFEKDKYLSLGVEYLLRKALEDVEIDYDKVKIEYNEFGKPYIGNFEHIYFNLSHSEEMCMCVVADTEVGCDVQIMQDDFMDIANSFFTPNELAYIENLKTYEEKKDMFYRLWTLKESYVKVLGVGGNLDFKSFEMIFETHPEVIKVKMLADIMYSTKYHLEEIEVNDVKYKAAVCYL